MLELTNWNGSQISNPEKIFLPKTTQEISEIIQNSKGKKITTVGPARCVWSRISSPGKDQYVIDMSHFNHIVYDSVNQTCTVGAGVRVHEINDYLDKFERTLINRDSWNRLAYTSNLC